MDVIAHSMRQGAQFFICGFCSFECHDDIAPPGKLAHCFCNHPIEGAIQQPEIRVRQGYVMIQRVIDDGLAHIAIGMNDLVDRAIPGEQVMDVQLRAARARLFRKGAAAGFEPVSRPRMAIPSASAVVR